jgi:predicted secreted protein with PEFG-CTERM motif
MAVALMSVTSVNQDVFAAQTGMSVTATAAEGSNIITINGETTSNITDVTIRVISPNGSNVVGVDQVTPNANGEFSTEFNVSNWKQDGMYKIKANQGTSLLYSITLSVDVTSGMTAETSTGDSSLVSSRTSGELDMKMSDELVSMAQGLSIEANAMEGSDTIGIIGHTSKTNEDVTFTVTAPNGNLMSVDQTSPKLNGDFATDISVGGSLWSQDGTYTVTAQQGNDSMFVDSVEVGVADGLVVPEFGTIAAMILAVAIISIIAISSKSRLSIVPRY